MKDMEPKINRDDLIYKTGDKKKDITYIFQKFKTTRSFGREVSGSIITLNNALSEQLKLKDEDDKFEEFTKQKNPDKKEKNLCILKTQRDF